MTTFENYQEAREFCDTRRARKLGNNTYLEDYGEEIAVRLHATRIVIFQPGSVTLNSGGWTTSTTKERMNRYLPRGFWCGEAKEWRGLRASVWQELGTWYFEVKDRRPPGMPVTIYRYADGITLHADGRVTYGPDGEEAEIADVEADKREYRRERARERRRLKAQGYVWQGYRGWGRPPEPREPELSHEERKASLDSRINSVLAECNPALPIYRAR